MMRNEGKTKYLSLRVAPELFEMVQGVADRNKTTHTEVIEMCIRSAIKGVDQRLKKIMFMTFFSENVIKED